MTDSHANDDLKAKMREALDRKNAKEKGVHQDGPAKEKAHGSEVDGGAPEDAPAQGRRRGLLTPGEITHPTNGCRSATSLAGWRSVTRQS